MKKKKRTYTVYLGGELFSLKHLVGNAWLAEAIYEKSHGRFRCLLPQDFFQLRGRSGRAIRDYNLRALVACDLALLNFDGSDLDSGTVVEFMYAKFADVPSVLLRTDIRNAGDYRRFAGRRAKLVMREAVDGQKFFRGVLGGMENDDVLIDAEDGRRHRVPVGVITRANLEVDF